MAFVTQCAAVSTQFEETKEPLHSIQPSSDVLEIRNATAQPVSLESVRVPPSMAYAEVSLPAAKPRVAPKMVKKAINLEIRRRLTYQFIGET